MDHQGNHHSGGRRGGDHAPGRGHDEHGRKPIHRHTPPPEPEYPYHDPDHRPPMPPHPPRRRIRRNPDEPRPR